MTDLHFRGKLKSIEKAAISNNIPNKTKNIGVGCFTLGVFLFVVFLLYLGISLFVNGIILGSIFTFVVSVLLIFILIKLWTAPNLP